MNQQLEDLCHYTFFVCLFVLRKYFSKRGSLAILSGLLFGGRKTCMAEDLMVLYFDECLKEDGSFWATSTPLQIEKFLHFRPFYKHLQNAYHVKVV